MVKNLFVFDFENPNFEDVQYLYDADTDDVLHKTGRPLTAWGLIDLIKHVVYDWKDVDDITVVQHTVSDDIKFPIHYMRTYSCEYLQKHGN